MADLGLYTVLVREISREGSNEKRISSKIFSFRLVVLILFLLAADLIAFALPYPLKVKIGILIASAFSFFSSLTQVLTGIFQKHLRLYLVSLSDVVSRLIQVGLLLVLVHYETGLLWFIGAVVLTEIIHFGLIFLFARTLTKVGLDFDLKYWKEIFSVALPIAISLVFVLIYFKLDTVLLSIMKSSNDVGVYSVAYKVLEATIFLPAVYVGLMMPVLSRHAFKNAIEFSKTLNKTFDVLAIFAFWFCGYIFLMADWIIKIIGGAGFTQAVPVLRILSLAVFLIFFGNLGGNAIIALNLQKKAMWIYFVGAVINLGANILLIPSFSYFATAWTTVLTEVIITLLMFYLIKKETGGHLSKKVFIRSAFSAGLLSLWMLIVRGNFAWASLSWLLYFPILFVLGGFSVEDVKEIIYLKKHQVVEELETL